MRAAPAGRAATGQAACLTHATRFLISWHGSRASSSLKRARAGHRGADPAAQGGAARLAAAGRARVAPRSRRPRAQTDAAARPACASARPHTARPARHSPHARPAAARPPAPGRPARGRAPRPVSAQLMPRLSPRVEALGPAAALRLSADNSQARLMLTHSIGASHRCCTAGSIAYGRADRHRLER